MHMHKACLSAAELPEAGPDESPTLPGAKVFHHGNLLSLPSFPHPMRCNGLGHVFGQKVAGCIDEKVVSCEYDVAHIFQGFAIIKC